MSRCENHWLGYHRFRARYDVTSKTTSVTPEQLAAIDAALAYSDDYLAALETLAGQDKTEIYVHDICTRCGEIKGRE